MKKIDKKSQIKILKIILIMIWMITIFIFSGQQGTQSSNASKNFTIIFIQIVTGKNLSLNNPFVETMQLFVRKFAHFTIYAIGGFLIMNYSYTIEKTMKKKILYSTIFGGIYAITDEVHQFFIPGRSAQIWDVFLDTSGVIAGVFVYIILRKVIERIRNKAKVV